MSDEASDVARARAAEIIRDFTEAAKGHAGLSHDRLRPIVEALEQDLRAVSNSATVAEERLIRIETQTRVLAEAIVAMTDTADTIAPAVKAVKDEM